MTVKVDPGDEQDTQGSWSIPDINALEDDDDDESDDDNMSGVSGGYDDNDEVPFGPSRAVAGQGKGQSKSLEMLRKVGSHVSHHSSHPGEDIEQGM